MLELMRKAVGFVFMTTVRLGGGISGMGGTGLVISRLQDGSWNEAQAEFHDQNHTIIVEHVFIYFHNKLMRF